MVEVSPLALVLVACVDGPSVLDRLAQSAEAHACRVAPDELWLLGPPGSRGTLLEYAREGVAETVGIAEDQTDAWSAVALGCPEAHVVFARLSAVPLSPERPSFIQCELAHVAGKALALAERLCLLVPAPVGHHLDERIMYGCSDLEPVRRPLVEFKPAARAGS